MATTVNVNNNYGTLTIIDGNVQLPGGRQMPLDEYEDLWQREEWERQARHAQLERAKAKEAAEEHQLDELISMMQLMVQSIEALRQDIRSHI